MKIILQENIEKLGTRGEVVEVAEGYARNYLLPRKFALAATAGNLKQLEKIRGRLAKIEAQEHSTAEGLATLISAASLHLERKTGQTGQLFGSVTAADIAEALAAQGITVDKRKVALAEPIKAIGEYQVTIKLHHNVSATVQLTVTPEGGVLPLPAAEATAEAKPAATPEAEAGGESAAETPGETGAAESSEAPAE
jgi:large subunit ribosomal protein L9